MELNWYSYGPPPPRDAPAAVAVYAVLSAATVGLQMNVLQLSVIMLATVFWIPQRYTSAAMESKHMMGRRKTFRLLGSRGLGGGGAGAHSGEEALPKAFNELWDFRFALGLPLAEQLYKMAVPAFLATMSVAGWLKFDLWSALQLRAWFVVVLGLFAAMLVVQNWRFGKDLATLFDSMKGA